MILLIILAVIVLAFGVVVFHGAPYVPTHRSSLDVLFNELLPVSDRDVLIDIGSGDGIVLRAAARRGARAIGYELNPVLVGISKLLSLKYGGKVDTRLANFWSAQFPSETTIVYTFGESRDIEKMYEKVVSEATRLQKQLFFVSYGFTLRHTEPIRSKHAMNIYEVIPLQQK